MHALVQGLAVVLRRAEAQQHQQRDLPVFFEAVFVVQQRERTPLVCLDALRRYQIRAVGWCSRIEDTLTLRVATFRDAPVRDGTVWTFPATLLRSLGIAVKRFWTVTVAHAPVYGHRARLPDFSEALS